MISICFHSRRGFKLLRRLHIKEDKFYLNFFPYQKTYISKDDRIINVFIYEGRIENADIILKKRYALDIIEKVLMNESTFEMIKYQIPSFHCDNQYCLINLLKIYNILKKFPSNIRNNILIMGSSILSVYGLRKFNDIDIYIRDTQIDDKIILNNLFDQLECIENVEIDITTEVLDRYYRPYWDNWKKEWSRISGIDNFNNILDKPDCHFYFCGMKFMSLKIDISRRLKRSRPNPYADLIMIKKYILPKLKLWTLPEYEIKFYDENIINKSNIEYVHMVKYNKDIKYAIFRKFNNKKFHHSLKRSLKTRYNIHMSIEDIINTIPDNTIIKYMS